MVTYVIAGMLAIVLVCSVMAASLYLPLPGGKGRRLHLKSRPGSIAAAMVLLAGSNLVRELREEGITVTAESQTWTHRFRLGWWEDGLPRESILDDPSDSLGAQRTRWGIDIVA